MKKLNILLFFVALATMSFGQNLAGSAHDFSDADAWNTLAANKMCGTCHTPHNAPQAASGPLWNHNISAAAFTVYTSPFGTMDAGALGQPTGVSLYCMSCHDGTVNVDAHSGGANATAIGAINATALVGTDLSNDHPVSFTYDATLATADGELHDPTTVTSGLGGTIAADMLFAGSMECGSCHDVHNYAGIAGLLVKTNVNSELCLTCHNK